MLTDFEPKPLADALDQLAYDHVNMSEGAGDKVAAGLLRHLPPHAMALWAEYRDARDALYELERGADPRRFIDADPRYGITAVRDLAEAHHSDRRDEALDAIVAMDTPAPVLERVA